MWKNRTFTEVARGTASVGCLLLWVSACYNSKLTPAGAAVRVTPNAEAVRGCQSLGLVKGADHMNGGMLGQGAASTNATIRLQNAAAKMGANVVLMINKQTNKAGSEAEGEAYKCAAAQ